MNTLDKFLEYIGNFVDYAIYAWGGQGEIVISEKQIRDKERFSSINPVIQAFNAQRAINFWRGKRFCNPVPMLDCSGVGVEGLKHVGVFAGDTTADGLFRKCTAISASNIRRGDWVFRIHKYGLKAGKAYHIGYVVDITNGTPWVIEAMGRDDGVVCRAFNNHKTTNYWTHIGRPSYFKQYIEEAEAVAKCPYKEPTRIYKSGVPFSGEGARWFIWHLIAIGYDLLEGSSSAQKKTWQAIHTEQTKAGLIAGDAGSKTRAILKKQANR